MMVASSETDADANDEPTADLSTLIRTDEKDVVDLILAMKNTLDFGTSGAAFSQHLEDRLRSETFIAASVQAKPDLCDLVKDVLTSKGIFVQPPEIRHLAPVSMKRIEVIWQSRVGAIRDSLKRIRLEQSAAFIPSIILPSTIPEAPSLEAQQQNTPHDQRYSRPSALPAKSPADAVTNDAVRIPSPIYLNQSSAKLQSDARAQPVVGIPSVTCPMHYLE